MKSAEEGFRFRLGGRLRIAHRVLLVVVVMALAVPAVLGFAAYSFNRVMMAERGETTQKLVEVANSVVKSYLASVQAGEMTEAEAKQQALRQLAALRYDEVQYFWVNDMQGTMLMHPASPKLVGTSIIDLKDAAGERVFANIIDLVRRQGSGHYDYEWLSDGKPKLKKSYVVGIPEWQWVLGSGVFVDDVRATVRENVIVMALVGVAVLFVAGVVCFFMVRSLVRPIEGLTGATHRLAAGELSTQIPYQDRSDEIGDLAKAVQVFKAAAKERDELAAQQAKEQQERGRRAEAIAGLTQAFDRNVGQVLAALGGAAGDLQRASATMSGAAEDSNSQAQAVASAAEAASLNVQTVAASAEELTAAISEIGRQMEQSSNIVRDAAAEAERTQNGVRNLAQAAQRIGEVVDLINGIASQTNLLALNATIEAARAGDAGRGFAVVAGEVKALANETGKATDEVANQINAVRSEIDTTVAAIQSITATIGRINEIAASIAAAVEEQHSATQEIARSVEQAAFGTGEVSSTIGKVSVATRDTGSAAAQVLDAAGNVNRQSDAIRGFVDDFLAHIRAA
jgi:Methyl-accepting chemotaxis protein